jgi:hypothetical protein
LQNIQLITLTRCKNMSFFGPTNYLNVLADLEKVSDDDKKCLGNITDLTFEIANAKCPDGFFLLVQIIMKPGHPYGIKERIVKVYSDDWCIHSGKADIEKYCIGIPQIYTVSKKYTAGIM